MSRQRARRVRWKALAPLGLFFVLLALLWHLFSDLIVRRSLEEAGTQVLGTQVDIGWLKLDERDAAVEIGLLAIADPFDSTRNLIAVDHLQVDLDPEPLLEKKIVITDLRLDGIALLTRREVPARRVEGGLAARTAETVGTWRERLQSPWLGIGAIDSIKSVVLDPSQLASVARAQRLAGQADSLRTQVAGGLSDLGLDSIASEARALSERVARANPSSLGVSGTRALVSDVNSMVSRIEEAEKLVARVDSIGKSGLQTVTNALVELDRARTEDYRRVESMLGLPNLEGPSLGGALFGQVSLSYLQRALYWAELVRQYMPPGLRPNPSPGPRRMRAAGTDMRFPKERNLPSFHLVKGGASSAPSSSGDGFEVTLSDITSAPALVGRPATASLTRTSNGQERFGFGAFMDHSGAVPVDSLTFRRAGVELRGFAIPGLPLRVEPGQGTARLAAALEGERFEVSLGLNAPEVAWLMDSTATGSVETELVSRVLRGLRTLTIEAKLGGTLSGLDRMDIRSNVDEALANQLKSVAGEALAEGKARARAEVDRLSAPYIAQARSQAGSLESLITQDLAQWQDRLAQARQGLNDEIKRKTGGLGGFIGMR